MKDLEAYADVVILTLKAALAPVLERVAALESRLANTAPIEPALSELRDRIVTMETKAAMPLQTDRMLLEMAERVKALEVPGRGAEGPEGPPGRDGKDADMDALRKRLDELVAALPVAKDGRDGSSFTLGIGPPTVDGRAGDAYLDVKTGEVYQCR